jgi:acyl CoA:acetate/3-ketoacid CoA transferase beta subunit
MRGAPGNTINHTTSYFVPNHTARVFVEKVDVVSGIGYDRAATLGSRAARFHCIRRVVSNLGVFDFETPDRSMRLASVHPGVKPADVAAATAFALVIPNDVPETRAPTDEELWLLRERIDPRGQGQKEIAA